MISVNKISAPLLTAALLLLAPPVSADVSSPTVSGESLQAPAGLAPAPPKKYFWRAAGEAIIIGYSPWLYSHYIADLDYADISMDTVRTNFEEGFVYDQDGFETNQWGHPFQGSIYYNAARENGFNFWQSAPFVLAGDLGWEFLMEAERPSYNDLTNTFFGGIARGEMTYRFSTAIRDNRATGSERFWRELGAGFVNPVGFIDRLIFGEKKKGDNPPDRLPSKLFMMAGGGYQRGRDNSRHPDQAVIPVELRYNELHETPIKKPFDYFDLEGSMTLSKGPLIPAITYRGLLAGWDVLDEADTHHMVSPGLTYNYFNNGATAFGGQGLDLTLLSRWKLSRDFEILTEAGGQGYIFAGIQTDYSTDSIDATGRNYDFGSGGGPRVDFRLRRNDIDWFRCTLSAGWFATNNGISKQNRLYSATTEARYPLTENVVAGLGWSFQERLSLYDDLPQTIRTNSGIKVALYWAFRIL